MGSNQSTRKITLVNDEKAGVIKLSESLAHRLRGQIIEGQYSKETPVEATQPPDSSVSSVPPSDPLVSDPITSIPSFIAPSVPEFILPNSESLSVESAPISELQQVEAITTDPPSVVESAFPIGEESVAVKEDIPSVIEAPLGVDLESSNSSVSETNLPVLVQDIGSQADLPTQPIHVEPPAVLPSPPIEPIPAPVFEPPSLPAIVPTSPVIEPIVVEPPPVVEEPPPPPVIEEPPPPPVVEEPPPPPVVEEPPLPPVVEEPPPPPVVEEPPPPPVVEVSVPPVIESVAISDVKPSVEPIEVVTAAEPSVPASESLAPKIIDLIAPLFDNSSKQPVERCEEIAVPLPVEPEAIVPANGKNGEIPSWTQYAEEAHLSILRLRDEKDEYINHQEKQWRERLANREHEYMEQAQLTKASIDASIKKVENLFQKTSQDPVCENMQGLVQQCFLDHPKQALRCSEVINQFSQCVSSSQVKKVSKEKAS